MEQVPEHKSKVTLVIRFEIQFAVSVVETS